MQVFCRILRNEWTVCAGLCSHHNNQPNPAITIIFSGLALTMDNIFGGRLHCCGDTGFYKRQNME
jgi:hypothetical protein